MGRLRAHRPGRFSRCLALSAAAAALVSACTSSHSAAPATSAAATVPSGSTVPSRPGVPIAPLAGGERWIDLTMPGGSYRPHADGGTDDYRCLLLDPRLSAATYLSGAVFVPGNPALVHHAILYRVDPDQVAAARARDAADARPGWTCFGDPGLPSKSGPLGFLESAPWVAAWATTGGEQRFAAGTGQLLPAHSRVVLQVHYNLLGGEGSDDSSVRLRVTSRQLTPLHTMLLPAPVELPCTASESGPLCDRDAAVLDVQRRFGTQAGATVAGLQLLCGGSFSNPRPAATQSCARPVPQAMRIRAVAGHMHLLGRSIRVDLQRADGTRQRLLDVRAWNFDDQRATVLARPVTVRPGDRLRVTCTHDAALRARLAALRTTPPRYVVWGAGSSDEMCLGIVTYTAG